MVNPDPEIDWLPTDPTGSRMAAFARYAERATGRDLSGNYHDLWQWSVQDLDAFWGSLWDWGGLPERRDRTVLADRRMPGASWFPGVSVNYAQELLRARDPDQLAVIAITEAGDQREVTWGELIAQVTAVAAYLRSVGVGKGSVVAGYLPNGAEAITAFLATATLGATWAVCGMDYSAGAALARLSQLEPRVLFAAERHTYAGKERDRTDEVVQIVAGLDQLQAVVLLDADPAGRYPVRTEQWGQIRPTPSTPAEFEQVPFDHPLWVLFSSGTTGRPKGILHGHGGVLLEYVKQSLHWDLGPGDRLFWYTTPSWMMWNFQVSLLISGATVVCYEGSPAHPTPDAFWRIAQDVGATVVGTSPAYLESCRKAGVSAIRAGGIKTVGVTGSAFVADTHRWLRSVIGPTPQIVSSSGGTDVVSAFAAGAPMLPTWVGELSGPLLGVDLAGFSPAGEPVIGEVGELVVRASMPSMPVSFWDDPEDRRYRDTYFSMFPGVWRHGDWITVTDRGSVVIHGRSDATLNRNGIRIGTADIYGPVEALPEIAEALVVGVELPDGGYWMPMFVAPVAGGDVDESLRDRIVQAIRAQATARHVPDEIIPVPGILHTKTGKKLEVPIKRLLMGDRLSAVMDVDAVDAPELLDWYAGFAQSRGLEVRSAHRLA